MTNSQSSTLNIGRILQNALAFDFKRRQSPDMNLESLLQTVDDLFDLLDQRSVEYVLVSGIAILQYVEGRNTEDIDLIMALSSLKQLPEIEIIEQDRFFARGLYRGLQIDVLLTANRLFEKVRREYFTLRPFGERTIPCATVEGLILLKLYALPSLYRQGNFARVGLYENDVATLMEAYAPAMDALLQELSAHLNDTDFAEVRSIVAELQQRIERFGRGFSSGNPEGH